MHPSTTRFLQVRETLPGAKPFAGSADSSGAPSTRPPDGVAALWLHRPDSPLFAKPAIPLSHYQSLTLKRFSGSFMVAP